MKRLNFMKLSAMCVLIFTMSSCLKTDEPDFGFVGLNHFMEQRNEQIEGGEVKKMFAPYFAVQANEPMSNCKLTLNSLSNYMMEPVDGTGKLLWQLRPSYGQNIFTPTLPNGEYVLTGTNSKGENYTYSTTYKINKELGVLNVKDLSYNVSKGITAEWDAVENATGYYLMLNNIYLEDGVEKVGAIKNIIKWDNITANTGTYRGYNIQSGEKFVIAVVAVYAKDGEGMLILQGPTKRITWGSDSEDGTIDK